MKSRNDDVPLHLWVIGVIALFANLMGAYDFVQSITGHPSYFARVQDMRGAEPRDAVQIVLAFPLWVKLAWAAATIGGTVGAILLLRRDGWAPIVFAVALVGIAVFSLYQAVVGVPAYVTGMTGAIFPIAIWSLATFLCLYAYRLRRAGVLR